MKNNKKILIYHTILTLLLIFIVLLSFILNLRENYIYILYIILSFLLFITIYYIKKIISNKQLKEYFIKCQQLMLYSTILFIFAFIFNLSDLIYLVYFFIIIGSIVFSMGFLKITFIGSIFKKKFRSKK